MLNFSTNQRNLSALPGSSFGSLWFFATGNSRFSDPSLPTGCWARDQGLLIIIKAREGAFLIKGSKCGSSFSTACQLAVPRSAQMTPNPQLGTGFLGENKGGKCNKKSSAASAEKGKVKKSVIVRFSKEGDTKIPFLLMLLRLKGWNLAWNSSGASYERKPNDWFTGTWNLLPTLAH